MLRVVADIGNTRLKWARIDDGGRPIHSIALPLDQPFTGDNLWASWKVAEPLEASNWAISTVNPPVAAQLDQFLAARGITQVTWYRSAAEVAIRHDLEQPESTGADRALTVAAAVQLLPRGQPALVISCGTALTIERITADGRWQGGVIAPGMAMSARALHRLTAQLPLIEVHRAPAAWGRSTQPALEAGVFWGTVGSVRELLARQADDMTGIPAVIWTGGDAHLLARAVAGKNAWIEPDLVLLGLAQVAFP